MTLLDEILPRPERTTGWPWTGRIGELPDHLSATQCNQVRRCAEQYRRRYVLGEKERPGAALIWGSADHYAHEVNFAQKILSHEDVSAETVEDAFAYHFDRRVEEFGDEVEWNGEVPGEVKDKGVGLVRLYHQKVSPLVQPTTVEREFALELQEVPVPVIGRMDLETASHAIERKTAKRKESEPKPEWRFQGALYQLVEKKPIAWHVSVKTRVPAVYTQREEPALSLSVSEGQLAVTEKMLASTARLIQTLYMTYGPEQPWPDATTHPWSCGFCGFLPTCSWWGNA